MRVCLIRFKHAAEASTEGIRRDLEAMDALLSQVGDMDNCECPKLRTPKLPSSRRPVRAGLIVAHTEERLLHLACCGHSWLGRIVCCS